MYALMTLLMPLLWREDDFSPRRNPRRRTCQYEDSKHYLLDSGYLGKISTKAVKSPAIRSRASSF